MSPNSGNSPPPGSPHFELLAASRRDWIQNVLRPWCHTATVQDLRRAELEWHDIAGRGRPRRDTLEVGMGTLPGCRASGLPGLNETWPVEVRLHSGQVYSGYPDARRSIRGQLILLRVDDSATARITETPPLSLDQVAALVRSCGDAQA
ncbi:MAG UNVERIFIED_CONTAM: hypothetical protein LVR18_29585 [Planctomycetaceae bacterium]